MQNTLSKIYYPPLVPSTEDFVSVFKKMNQITGYDREIFFSDELVMLVKKYADRYHLTNEQITKVSQAIRRWFFHEESDDVFAQTIGRIIGRSATEGKQLLEEIKQIKVTQKPAEGDTVQQAPVHTTRLTLTDALKTYPTIARQRVTAKPIVVKPGQVSQTQPFQEPLAPTVHNWLHVYEMTVGAQKQTAVVRANFLYQSPLCRGLSDIDRTHLGELLHARDENITLLVDTDNARILWQSKRYAPLVHQQKPTPQQRPKTQTTQRPARQSLNTPPQKKSRQATPTKMPRTPQPPTQRPPQRSATPSTPQPQSAPITTQKPPRTHHEPRITSLKKLRGQATTPDTISPQHFAHTSTATRPPRARITQVAPRNTAKQAPTLHHKKPASVVPSAQSTTPQTPTQPQNPAKNLATKLPTPQSRTISSATTANGAREKIDKLMRADLPYQSPQKNAPQATPQKPAKNLSFSSGQTMPAETSQKKKKHSRFKIKPITRGF